MGRQIGVLLEALVDKPFPPPEAPSFPWRFHHHLHLQQPAIYLVVTDIPASTDDTSYGREVVCYESPNTATGIHRMVLLLFRQLGRETVFAPSMGQNFNTRTFARCYNLGGPVAAMYFNCQRQACSGGPTFTGAYTSRRQQR